MHFQYINIFGGGPQFLPNAGGKCTQIELNVRREDAQIWQYQITYTYQLWAVSEWLSLWVKQMDST